VTDKGLYEEIIRQLALLQQVTATSAERVEQQGHMAELRWEQSMKAQKAHADEVRGKLADIEAENQERLQKIEARVAVIEDQHLQERGAKRGRATLLTSLGAAIVSTLSTLVAVQALLNERITAWLRGFWG